MRSAVVALALAACGGGRAPAPLENHTVPTTILSAADAIARFDASYDAMADGAPDEEADRLRRLDDERHAGRATGPSAAQRSCAEVAQQVNDTRSHEVVAGTVDALEAAGSRSCWVVELASGFQTFLAVFAADTGALLVAWLPPEG